MRATGIWMAACCWAALLGLLALATWAAVHFDDWLVTWITMLEGL